MDQPPEQIQSELDNFRKQWRAEVSARSKKPVAAQQRPLSETSTGPSSIPDRPPRRHDASHKKTVSKVGHQLDDDDDGYVQAQHFDDPEPRRARGGQRLDGQDSISTGEEQEPQTALDFYEEAVEKETKGKLGDSLQLYRKAFRMDDNVDQSYRNKHFPGRWVKPTQVNPSNAPVTVPNTAHHSLEGPTLSMPDLIAGFANLKIEGVPSECDDTAAPPCPIAQLPDEILVHILRDVAVADVGDFVRLAQVCKRLAYLVATEEQIWRRVCLGSEFGFGSMHYHWQRGILWEPLNAAQRELDADADADVDVFTIEELATRQQAEKRASTNALLHSLYASSWRGMFRLRPRVRFNGCYISTVNYIRAGQASTHQVAWNSPVHIVTYYRYLRFFRDGTAISLCTTDEPAHVVPHLTKDSLALHAAGALPHLPSFVMSSALRGRWRLSSALDRLPPDGAAADDSSVEGDLYVETEGVGPKYVYRMDLAFRTTGKLAATRNNKLAWKGFWSYNKLTDDWAEFTLKNDKPFFFSRVKSYGVGV
ncbi:hypothetical protein F4779DRAFT_582065 [Xylariaceae sp. FL0662B]|nr:hypothetical protein F4779DRAFT_582065 [Xylariaceae sp. FL0662B]